MGLLSLSHIWACTYGVTCLIIVAAQVLGWVVVYVYYSDMPEDNYKLQISSPCFRVSECILHPPENKGSIVHEKGGKRPENGKEKVPTGVRRLSLQKNLIQGQLACIKLLVISRPRLLQTFSKRFPKNICLLLSRDFLDRSECLGGGWPDLNREHLAWLHPFLLLIWHLDWEHLAWLHPSCRRMGPSAKMWFSSRIEVSWILGLRILKSWKLRTLFNFLGF